MRPTGAAALTVIAAPGSGGFRFSASIEPPSSHLSTSVGSSTTGEAPGAGSSAPRDLAQTTGVEPRRTRLQSGIRKPKVYTNGTVRYGCFTSSDEPRNVDEALANQNRKIQWIWNIMPYSKTKLGI
jgi:hypothetical protein